MLCLLRPDVPAVFRATDIARRSHCNPPPPSPAAPAASLHVQDDGSIELRLDFESHSGWGRQLLLAACDALAVLKAVSRRRRVVATQLLLGVLQRSDRTLQRTVFRLLLAATETKEVMLEVVRQAMEGIDKASGGRVKVGRARRWLHPHPGAACFAPLSVASLELGHRPPLLCSLCRWGRWWATAAHTSTLWRQRTCSPPWCRWAGGWLGWSSSALFCIPSSA